jgi:hypothetical protein
MLSQPSAVILANRSPQRTQLGCRMLECEENEIQTPRRAAPPTFMPISKAL